MRGTRAAVNDTVDTCLARPRVWGVHVFCTHLQFANHVAVYDPCAMSSNDHPKGSNCAMRLRPGLDRSGPLDTCSVKRLASQFSTNCCRDLFLDRQWNVRFLMNVRYEGLLS